MQRKNYILLIIISILLVSGLVFSRTNLFILPFIGVMLVMVGIYGLFNKMSKPLSIFPIIIGLIPVGVMIFVMQMMSDWNW